jgi:hypothetical protein
MDKKEAILKIKETLKSLMKFDSEIVENTFAEVLTKDGLKLTFDSPELTTDIEIYQLDEEGNKIPLEDNEYLLQDGKVIVVVSGKVSEIKEDVVVSDETPIEEANVEQTKDEEEKIEDEEKMEDIVEEEVKVEGDDLTTKVAELEEKLKKVMELLNSLTGISEEMSEKFEEFCKMPGEDVSLKSFSVVDSRFERIRMIKDSVSNLKK